jgi:predicted nucleotidyltransferase
MSALAAQQEPDRSFPPEYTAVREVLASVMQREGIALAVLHGSRARGEGHRGSDLDVGLLAADAVPLPYATMGRLAAEVSALLGADVDVSDLATPDAVFRYEVARCARVLFEGSAGAFRDFVGRTLVDYSDIQRFLPELVAGVARVARGEAGTGARREGPKR